MILVTDTLICNQVVRNERLDQILEAKTGSNSTSNELQMQHVPVNRLKKFPNLSMLL